MTKIQNSKPVLVIGYWNLRFICNLVLGVWDFIDSSTSVLQNSSQSLPAKPLNFDLALRIRFPMLN